MANRTDQTLLLGTVQEFVLPALSPVKRRKAVQKSTASRKRKRAKGAEVRDRGTR